MRNTRLDYILTVLLLLIGLVGVYATIQKELGWFSLVYPVCCLLLGSTYFLEPMRRWRRTIFWITIGSSFFYVGIKNGDNDGFLQFGHIVIGIGMMLAGLISAVYTVMKRENELPEI